jgi:hypothetical protein
VSTSFKRTGAVTIPEWEGEEPYFDVVFARARSQGGAQVGVAQPRRILDGSDLTGAHTCPSSSDAVVAAYENGILVGGLRGSLSISLLAWFGFLPACGLMFMGLWCAYVIVQAGAGVMDQPGLAIGLAIAGVIGFTSGVSIFSVLLRVLVFMPSDFPVLLNRKLKEVWVAVPAMPSFFRIFELSPVIFERHSWASLKPRTYRLLEVTPGASSARWTYILTLVFGQEDDPRKVACEMNIGFKGWGDDFELLQLWEHIRRYMNDAGPALDQGEKFKTFSTGRLPKFPDEAMAALGRKLSESEAWEITGA